MNAWYTCIISFNPQYSPKEDIIKIAEDVKTYLPNVT